MQLAHVLSRAQDGIDAPEILIEVHISGGLPSLGMVGLPAAGVRESKDRVRSAIMNTGFEFPRRRVTVNLAPADLPKEGARFDLAIAIGILVASGQLPAEGLEDIEFLGELSLAGDLRAVRGALPAAGRASQAGRRLVLPTDNGSEAALVSQATLGHATHLLEVTAALRGERALPVPEAAATDGRDRFPDLADVRGQHQARRALEVAAAGGHSLLFTGPPGTGKSMLASRLPGILPPMNEAEALETAAVRSISGDGLDPAKWRARPFRCPHHTASGAALVGGGSHPRPGEISLAHHGVLFLDELPEFSRQVLEVLREPLESGEIHISRAARQARFPARFQLVAAMNPCPCGYLGDPVGDCRCTADQVARYRAKISGPLLDRIDMQLEVPRPDRALLRPDAPPGEPSAAVRERVILARERQHVRQGSTNARLDAEGIRAHCQPDDHGQRLLEQAGDRLGFSARAYHRILRLARTLADLREKGGIGPDEIGEAIGYRGLDRRETISDARRTMVGERVG
jgi:magnesium chelatase family protein